MSEDKVVSDNSSCTCLTSDLICSIPCCRQQKPIAPPGDFAVAVQPSAERTVAQPTPEGRQLSAEIGTVKPIPEGSLPLGGGLPGGSLPPEGSPPEGRQNVCLPVSQQSIKLLDLGDDDIPDMDDQLPPGMQRRLEKCHLEGFIECVKEHVTSLATCKIRK